MKTSIFVTLKRAGLAALTVGALALVVGCEEPTSAKVTSDTVATQESTDTTLGTLAVTGSGITDSAAVLHLVAEAGTFTVTASDGSATKSTVVGTAWWSTANTEVATTIADGKTVTYTVVIQADATDFMVEVHDVAATKYFSTTSQLTGWIGGSAKAGTVTGALTTGVENTLSGHTWAVSVTRSGDTFTVKYVDKGIL